MNYSDLAEVDRELEDLGSVPEQLSRIVARYGGLGLDFDEVDETLEAMASGATPTERDPGFDEVAQVGFDDREPESEVQEEPEAEVIAGEPFEVFQDDVDESVAQEVLVEAESPGLIQRVSGEPSEVSVSDEAPIEDEPVRVEYSDVLPEELTPIDEESFELSTLGESSRHSLAEFVDENGQELAPSDAQNAGEEDGEQTTAAEPEFDAVYFHEAEEELPATEELRAYRDLEFDRYDDDAAYASERPTHESTNERNPFRDSEYKRLLELELDPSDFPQSEPTSSPPPPYDTEMDADFEALDDDDIVEIEDEDIEISSDTDGAVVSVDDDEMQDEIIEMNDDDSRR